MKRENSKTSKIITIVLGLVLCAYIGYQTYRALYNPVETISAVYVEVDDSVHADGCIVRDEKTLIKNYGSGVLEIVPEEGERVKTGNLVALVHRDQNSASKKQEVSEIETEINQMTALYAQSNENYDIEKANKQIADSAVSLSALMYNGRIDEMEEKISELKFNTLMREFIYRDKEGLKNIIDELKIEKNRISADVVINNRIYSSSTGYFSQYTDGYENVLSSVEIMNMSPTKFEEVCSQFSLPPENSIGKIISNNRWYFVISIDEKTAQRFKEGSGVGLKFNDRHLPEVNAEVVRKTNPENGKVLLALACDTNIDRFTQARKLEANIVLTTYSGLRVPREALRVNHEGVQGVYCLIDSQVKFKPVTIIFEKDGYYIVEYDTNNTKSLLLYDEIVVSSKDLENKKIIK